MSSIARTARRLASLGLMLALLAGCDNEWEMGGAYDLEADSSCNTTNPLTGACSCPDDFETLNMNEAGATVCWSEKSDAGWEWGGAFDKSGSTCVVANPRTEDCTCPSGFTELFLTEVGASVCWAGHDTQPGWRFGGAFDATAAGGCSTANPQTDQCTCPDGFTALGLTEAGFTLCYAE